MQSLSQKCLVLRQIFKICKENSSIIRKVSHMNVCVIFYLIQSNLIWLANIYWPNSSNKQSNINPFLIVFFRLFSFCVSVCSISFVKDLFCLVFEGSLEDILHIKQDKRDSFVLFEKDLLNKSEGSLDFLRISLVLFVKDLLKRCVHFFVLSSSCDDWSPSPQTW